MRRGDLEQQWLTLTRTTLPALAQSRKWPIRNDHCFQRVLLDNACGEQWYAQITERPAYKHASDAILSAAVALATQLIDGTADLTRMNQQSLRFRGKL